MRRKDVEHGTVGLTFLGCRLHGNGNAGAPGVLTRDALNLGRGLNFDVHDHRAIKRLGKRGTDGHNEHTPRGVQVASLVCLGEAETGEKTVQF